MKAKPFVNTPDNAKRLNKMLRNRMEDLLANHLEAFKGGAFPAGYTSMIGKLVDGHVFSGDRADSARILISEELEHLETCLVMMRLRYPVEYDAVDCAYLRPEMSDEQRARRFGTKIKYLQLRKDGLEYLSNLYVMRDPAMHRKILRMEARA